MAKPFSEEKRQEWKQLIQKWEMNDRKISMTQWCREQNINYDIFLYWKKRLGSESIHKIDRSSFQELTPSATTTGIVLECNQIRIQLAKNFDTATLTKCLRILKEAVC